MKLHATLFDGRNQNLHERLANALDRSAAENSPETPLTIHRIKEADDELYNAQVGRKRNRWFQNARKSKHWNEIVQATPDGELIGLIDIDALIVDSFASIVDLDFDVAYTVGSPTADFVNDTGLVFFRSSDSVRRWFDLWTSTVFRMLSDLEFHTRWRVRFGGIHQAALGYLMKHSPLDLAIVELDFREWNNNAPAAGETPRMLHIVGPLRNVCFGGKTATENIANAALLWDIYDQENDLGADETNKVETAVGSDATDAMSEDAGETDDDVSVDSSPATKEISEEDVA